MPDRRTWSRSAMQTRDGDVGKNPLAVGPMLTFDTEREQFVGDDSYYANMLLSRNYRAPFVVPETV